jgi:quercetin dioxygenase-like cupin family protein
VAAAKEPLSIPQVARTLPAPWETHDLVSANDSVFRVVRVEGTMGWHRHSEDQLFLCWSGTFKIEMEGLGTVVLNPGDVYVVPRQTSHQTSTETNAVAVMSIGLHTLARA